MSCPCTSAATSSPVGAAAAAQAAAAPVVAAVEAEWTAHLGADARGALRTSLTRLREITDPWA